MANEVYDEQADELGAPMAGAGPGRLENQPAGKPYDPRRHDVAANDPSDPRGGNVAANNPSDPRGDDGSVPTPEQLQAAEEAGLPSSDAATEDEFGDEPGNGYARGFPNGQPASKGGRQSFLRRNRSKIIIGGGLFGGGFGGIIIVLITLIPLKIETMVNNLESHFYGAPQAAVQGMTQNLLQNYLVNWVIPNYKNCGTTIDRHCKVTIYSTRGGPVTNLYKAWASERIENQLAAPPYNIELAHRPLSNTWYIKGPGISDPKGDPIGDGSGLDHEFKRVDRLGFQEVTREATATLTKYKQLYVRYKINRLDSYKYGNKHYIFFNGTRNAIHGGIDELKKSAKIEITQRVITPVFQTYGIAMQCLLTDCNSTSTQPTDPSTAPEQAGFPENPETDTQIRQGLVDLASKYNGANLEDVLSTFNEIEAKGPQKYLVTKALAPIIGEANASSAADKIPVVIGWLNMAAQIVNGANDAGPKIKKLGFAIKVAGAVNIWILYRTYADEIHTGHVDGTELASMTTSLSGGNDGSPSDPELGGTASAEQAPVYNAYVANGSGSGSATAASLFSSLLPAKAYAATAGSSGSSTNYLCNNGKPVPKGQMVCDEEMLGGGNGIANSVHDFLNNTPGVSVITSMASAWQSLFGPVSSFIGDVSGSALSFLAGPANLACSTADTLGVPAALVPPPFNVYCVAKNEIAKASPLIIKGVTTALIPNPFGTNMSGGRKLDMMAAGADASGNTNAQIGLGGQKITPTQSAAIVQSQQNEARADFEHQSFFARMFSTDSQYSLVSNLAMAVPLDTRTSMESGFASLISDPLNFLGNSFASIFSFSSRVSAATTPAGDPFGIPQYGYPSGTIPSDPDAYWQQHCSDNAAHGYESDADYNAAPGTPGRIGNWSQQAANKVDPENGMPESDNVNPCLLIKATTGVDGGLFDQSLLTPDDLSDSSGSSSSTTATTTTTPPTAPTTVACSVDDSAAPGLATVAAAIKDACQQNFPKIEVLLSPSPFPPPHKIVFTNANGTGPGTPADTVNNIVYLNITYFRNNPSDIGVIVHEDTHVVQGYGSKVGTSQAPHWLVEGMADWVRYHLGYTQAPDYHCTSSTTYLSGYNCAAVFLDYLSGYDSNIVQDAHNAIRQGTYNDTSFIKQKTGSDLTTLYGQCLASNCAGGKAL